ncbi:MAG: sugar phosphate isomerase/epimerase [Verrucomicrobia bacterium]|nr:sugar phosphate isomerase/epimerase [Verrucomicrobiota bacterium]
MNIEQELGVQSYCFRAFKKNEEVAGLVKKCGLSMIELCAVHLDFTDKTKWAEVIDLYRSHGIRIGSIGVQRFQNDAKLEKNFFEFVKRAGAKVISADFAIDSVPSSYRTAEKLAEEYDVNLAIHNHGGRHWLGAAAMLCNVFANTSPRIGLCLDTAWALDSGEDPIKMAVDFGERLYGVHIKDFVFDRARKHRDVVVGSGNLDLKKLLVVLKKSRSCASTVLEYEGDVNNPVPALRKCVAAVRKAG